MSHADGMLDHDVAFSVYNSNAERANPFVAMAVSILPRLQLLQDISALCIAEILIINDFIIQLLQIFSNKTKVSTTL